MPQISPISWSLLSTLMALAILVFIMILPTMNGQNLISKTQNTQENNINW